MSYNGSGTFNINTAGQPVVTGTVITSTAFNLLTADLASGLTTALTKDGQTTPTANIPMGTFKITGLGAGTAATDAAQFGQLQAGATQIATVTGTDTYVGTLSPSLAAYATGNLFSFVAPNTNTGASTINLNSLGAKNITKLGSTALAAGDIVSGRVYLIEYDGTRFQLINPSSVSSFSAGSTGFTPSTATTGAVTLAGTLATTNGGTGLTSFTANGVVYASSSSALTTGSALVFDGTNFSTTGSATGTAFIPSGSTVPTNGMYLPTTNTVAWSTNTTERMRLDSSGSLGLGVTPSAWTTTNAATAQLKNISIAALATNDLQLSSNAYFDGSSWRYIASSVAATNYYQSLGAHVWRNAVSGTAGNVITYTNAMSLDASGNLLVGTTSASLTNSNSQVFGGGANNYSIFSHVSGTSSGAVYQYFAYNATSIGSITQSGTTAVAYNTSSDYRLKNITGPITTSGAYIDSLNPVEGTWKADGSTFVGLIAHEVQEASRTPVATGIKDGEEMQGMDYSSAEIIANLIAEIQSLRKRLATAGI